MIALNRLVLPLSWKYDSDGTIMLPDIKGGRTITGKAFILKKVQK